MDGMTGLNLEQAQTDIMNFSQAAGRNRKEFYDAFGYLYDELYNIWASPNAKQFGVKYKGEIADRLGQYDEDIAIICTNARRAYNILASSNGAPQMGDSKFISYLVDGNYSVGQYVGNFPDLLEEKNGIVGINIELVKIVIDSFNTKIKIALNNMMSLPKAISFYDPAGSLQASFDERISHLQKKIEATISEINSAITKALETENNNALLAKQKAVNKMSA